MSLKVIVLCDPSFPAAAALPAPDLLLQQGGEVLFVKAHELAGALQQAEGGCFVNLHAPFFPKSAWAAIAAYLRQGGGWMNVGGAPFKIPVRWEEGSWKPEAEQTAYHQELYIHETLPVDAAKVISYTASDTLPLLEGYEELFPLAGTWNLVPHTTRNSDLPHQMGSAGSMSTQIYPLLKGVSAAGREIAAPVVLWENSRGTYSGSRWLFIHLPLTAAFWEQSGMEQMLNWAAYCARGVTELSIRPNYASYEAGEQAILTLQTQRLQRARLPAKANAAERWSFEIKVTSPERSGSLPIDQRASQLADSWEYSLKTEVTHEQKHIRIPVKLPLGIGLHRIVCRAVAPDGEVRILRQGYWRRDEELLAAGQPIARSRDYFIKEGRPLPVVGMTYMTSDVARKFLFLPNADVWDRDMAQMAKAGINWIRTGVWTAYRNIMQVDGYVSEEVLRAVDAFFLTAKRHGLQVTFTFFSFTPETWEGVNPYLDPQSVEAQKRFIRSIVSRHTASTHIDWDLINEPSMFDPARIFAEGPRSARDPYEQKAFIQWLIQRHGSIEQLQERWNMSPEQLPDFCAAVIPEPEDINFDVQDMHRAKKGTRWLDYCLFSMDMHNRWARELRDTIKQLVPNHLVTIGQDEALGAQRPSPFFYEEAVDYTTVHSWWFNDFLVWDGIFAKTPDKPNLIQETGVMYVETPDGRAKRTESELRNLLERKYAYAFSTGGAGAIHWIWNTNFYMDNANESHIGALRADGTEKPEADVSYDFGRFMNGIRDLFQDRQLEDIAVVFPYSNDFSNRPLAFDATTRLTRVLAYDLKLPFRAVSEYHLDSLDTNMPKLLILPSAHNFEDKALARLLELVETAGSTLLVTGSLGIDAYWHTSGRADELVGARRLGNVQREEMLRLDGRAFPVSYGHRRIAEVAKEERMESRPSASGAVPSGGTDDVVEVPLGKGQLIWCPLPLELNDRDEPIQALYRYAAGKAGITAELEWLSGGELPGVYGRKLAFHGGSLYVFVSEYAWNADVRVRDAGTGNTYAFELEKGRSVLFATDRKGQLLGVYRPEEVKIELEEGGAER
ncbi:beta-galactosidase [Paenibacillus sp. JX-17]|uniref:Beta-galactosidase n=1 Tax=Paenibacillus lacisoli TaxID=3064525 RepID=A0ABT9CFX2_9BACL|nr:beta-galactosidase [Paenibacillus sp. JX-17]MDO7908177.1 beta-galactosidase [Paenibacillus sp. JX-17]